MLTTYLKYFLIVISIFVLQFLRANDTPFQFTSKIGNILFPIFTLSVSWFLFYRLTFKLSLPNHLLKALTAFCIAGILLYITLVEAIIIDSGSPQYTDRCVIEKGAYFSTVEQEWILAEGYRDYRVVKSRILTPSIRLSFPVFSDKGLKCN